MGKVWERNAMVMVAIDKNGKFHTYKAIDSILYKQKKEKWIAHGWIIRWEYSKIEKFYVPDAKAFH